MIKFIIIDIYIFLSAIVGYINIGIIQLVKLFNKDKAAKMGQNMLIRIINGINSLSGVKVDYVGLENIPDNEPVLYVGNHRSFFDIFLTYPKVKTLTSYIAKDSYGKIPFLAHAMKSANCLFLNRENPREGLKTILKAIELEKSGYSIFIFPEGTRNTTDDLLLPFKEGSMKVSEKTGCAIIPVAISNSRDVFEAHYPKVKGAHVIIEYGKPIYPADLTKEEKKFLGAYTQKKIAEMLEKNNELI